MPTPLRDVTANRPPKESNPHFKEEVKEGDKAYQVLASKGKYEVQVPKDLFEQIIEVTNETLDGVLPIRFLKWKKHPSRYIRSTTMNRILKLIPVFKDHIDGRYDQRGKISAAYDYEEKDKDRGSSRARHSWAVWQNGVCTHRINEDIACGCTFDFGFEFKDIQDLYQESRENIRMTVVVHSDCKHEKNKLFDRCAGIDRLDVCRAYAFDEHGVYTGVDATKLYENHKPGHHRDNKLGNKSTVGPEKTEVPDVTIKSRKVANKIRQQGHEVLMDHYGFKKGDTLSNLLDAAQLCRDQDAEIRSKLLEQHGEAVAEYIGGEYYMGILREHHYVDDEGNRGTIPLNVQFFTKNSIQVQHEICECSKRGVIAKVMCRLE